MALAGAGWGPPRGRFRSCDVPKHRDFEWILQEAGKDQKALKDVTDARILSAAQELRPRLRCEGLTRELVGRTFALVREAAGRHLGMAHFDVQLIGGCVLLSAMVAEMETGEGKTLVATLPACTLALAGGWRAYRDGQRLPDGPGCRVDGAGIPCLGAFGGHHRSRQGPCGPA